MPRIRIHWNLLSAGRIPKAIRLSLETRMTFLGAPWSGFASRARRDRKQAADPKAPK
jgi:hypothetical protein